MNTVVVLAFVAAINGQMTHGQRFYIKDLETCARAGVRGVELIMTKKGTVGASFMCIKRERQPDDPSPESLLQADPDNPDFQGAPESKPDKE